MITIGDFIETYFKIKQRGLHYILSKFNLDKNTRVRNTFNETEAVSSNYWIIPEIRERWNTIITGDPQEEYADYVVKKYLRTSLGLKMLSLGCGSGSHELKFARHSNFSEVKGIDLAPKLIEEANTTAVKNGLSNLHYEVANVYETPLPNDYYDVVLFHSSLHHFTNLDQLLGKTIRNTLKKDGLLIIHEYVGPNRIQWTSKQLTEVKHILSSLPPAYRKRYRLPNIKTRAHRPGTLRMIISDPSEAVESANILPVIHTYYSTLEEKPLGGNLIMPLFKDIAHHFTDRSADTKKLLAYIFEKEATFIKTNPSDFAFGIYKKND